MGHPAHTQKKLDLVVEALVVHKKAALFCLVFSQLVVVMPNKK
jgi:hypothetical protein